MWVFDIGYDNTGKVYGVGYVVGDTKRHVLRCSSIKDAIELVHYLNGGGDAGTLISLGRKYGPDGSDKPIREIPEA